MAGYGTGNSYGSGNYRSNGYGNRGNGNNFRDNGRTGNYSGGNRDGNVRSAVVNPHVMLDEKTYVDTAEAVIKSLNNRKMLLTTSKIRNLLSMISSLYDEVRRARRDTLSDAERERIQYIRLHFAYEAGRDRNVKEFVTEADIFEHIKDIGDNKTRFILFCRYMEALVAYHRYYEGKE